MAKRYDPIMCMLVDEPTKAQDAAYEIKEIGEPKYSIDKSKKFGLFVNGKLVARAVSKEAAEKMYETFYKKKAQDELKIVKEDGLWSVYKDGKQVGQSNSEAGAIRIYNRLESVKDSASALDKAITTADGATGDKLYADVKAIYNLFSNILLTYTNEQSVQKLANEGTKKCLELAAKVKGVRDEAIKACDASTGHKVVVFVENYLRSIGKNNSTGKYDRIVQGVRSLLSQSLLDDDGLKKAAEHEADRLLKKYNL